MPKQELKERWLLDSGSELFEVLGPDRIQLLIRGGNSAEVAELITALQSWLDSLGP